MRITLKRHKATSAGSCQACGRVQKLPDAQLSLHGYTVQWNCFNGQCPGSKHEPYELSCKLIERFIVSARQQRADIQARIDQLNQPATEPKAWVSEYVPATWQNKQGRYQSRLVTIFAEPGMRSFVFWFDLEGKRVSGLRHSLYGTPLEVANTMNEQFITHALNPIVKQLDEYIRWQQKRVTDWKLRPLRDLKEVR